MKKFHSKEITITDNEGGGSLLEIVKSYYPSFSNRKIKRLIEEKTFFINGYPEIFSGHKIKKGDRITFDEKLLNKSYEMPILYEDNDLVAYNKPAYVSSSNEMQVHRLDRETTGVYLVAKTQKAKLHLEAQFKERKIRKRYWAITNCSSQFKEGTKESSLSYKFDHNKQKIGFESSHGQKAIATYSILDHAKQLMLVNCLLITGRTHQVRIQLSSMGAPVIGDEKYGKQKAFPFYVTRHMLHCKEMEFTHPTTQKPLLIKAPLPPDFLEIKNAYFNH